jgi:uncharacterized membrane protein
MMPYQWMPAHDDTRLLRLWPYRSLTETGFVWFIGTTAALIALPLVVMIGQPVLWGLLPFVVAAVAGVWWALSRNAQDRTILEELSVTRDQLRLIRRNPHGPDQVWEANPYWVRLNVHPIGGPVPHYVTLNGNGREVEIGAFLSEDERVALGRELGACLSALR